MSREPRRPEPPNTYSGAPLSAAPSYGSQTYAQAEGRPPASASAYDNNRWRDPQPSYAAAPSYQPSYQPQYSQQQAYQPQRPYQPSYQPQGYQPQAAYQPQPQAYQPRYYQPGPQAQAYAAPITTGSLGPQKKSESIVVRQGDTLYSLSRHYGVPVADLVTANRIQDGKIKVGQNLVIPQKPRW